MIKPLSHYLKAETAKLINETGAFFAHSEEDLKEKSKDGIKYVSLGAALVAPEENASETAAKFSQVRVNAMLSDIAENSLESIIEREETAYYNDPDYELEEYNALIAEYKQAQRIAS